MGFDKRQRPVKESYVAASTGTDLPNNGVVLFESTGAGTYTMMAPEKGVIVHFVQTAASTLDRTINTAGGVLIDQSNTYEQLTFQSKGASISLIGISSADWAILAQRFSEPIDGRVWPVHAVTPADLAALAAIAPGVKVATDIPRRNLKLEGIWINVVAVAIGIGSAFMLPDLRLFPETSNAIGNLIATGLALGLGAGYLSDLANNKP